MGKKLKEIRLETRHDLVKQTGDMNSSRQHAAEERKEKKIWEMVVAGNGEVLRVHRRLGLKLRGQ